MPERALTAFPQIGADATKARVRRVQTLLDAAGARDITVTAMPPEIAITEVMIVASMPTGRQARDAALRLQSRLRRDAGITVEIEGTPESGWICLHGGGILVHVFEEKTRAIYRLDTLWRAFVTPRTPAEDACRSLGDLAAPGHPAP